MLGGVFRRQASACGRAGRLFGFSVAGPPPRSGSGHSSLLQSYEIGFLVLAVSSGSDMSEFFIVYGIVFVFIPPAFTGNALSAYGARAIQRHGLQAYRCCFGCWPGAEPSGRLPLLVNFGLLAAVSGDEW